MATSHVELTIGGMYRQTVYQAFSHHDFPTILSIEAEGGPNAGRIADILIAAGVSAIDGGTNVVVAMAFTILTRDNAGILDTLTPWTALEISHNYLTYTRDHYPLKRWALRVRTSTYDDATATFAADGHIIIYFDGAVLATHTGLTLSRRATSTIRVTFGTQVDTDRIWVMDTSMAPPVEADGSLSGGSNTHTLLFDDFTSADLSSYASVGTKPYTQATCGVSAGPGVSGLTSAPSAAGFSPEALPTWRDQSVLVVEYPVSTLTVDDTITTPTGSCIPVRDLQTCLAEVDTPFDDVSLCDC